jgi:hypothetical protein
MTYAQMFGQAMAAPMHGSVTGWLILDPERKDWPPKGLRTERTCELFDKVTDLFCDLVNRYDLPKSGWKLQELRALTAEFHKLRKYRIRLLHSVFIELKAGGEVIDILRSNPKPVVDDTETGEITFDSEIFTEELINKKIKEIAEPAFRLGMLYKQLIHWSPFERFPKRA